MQALKRAQRELELGAMSPLDIYQPAAGLRHGRDRRVAGASSRCSRRRTPCANRSAPISIPQIRNLPDRADRDRRCRPPTPAEIDAEAAVQKALCNRPGPEIRQPGRWTWTTCRSRASKNALLPDLSLLGTYTTQGRGGNFYQRRMSSAGGSQIVSVTPGGFGDALSQMFGFGYPDLRNSACSCGCPSATARPRRIMADAMVTKKRDTLTVRNVAADRCGWTCCRPSARWKRARPA